MSTTELTNLVNRLESVALRLEKVADITTGKITKMNQEEPLAPFVGLYDQILCGSFNNFLQLSNQIGGDLKTQTDLVSTAFKTQRQILILASKSQAPKPDVLDNILHPISDSIQAIQGFREKNRGSKLINHLSAISEAIPSLGWLAVSPTPAPYIKDMIEAGQFYTNRVLVEYKEKDKIHCDWARSWIQTLTELQLYVKANHTTGLTWNSKGSSAVGNSTGGPGGPPPPPPPPPMEIFSAGPPSAEDPRAALFREINKGEGITHALKRVDPTEQTHKNPGLRCQGATPYKAPASGPKAFQPVIAPKTPMIELEGKKWKIEHHNGNKNIVISETEMNQGVHVFHCNDCLLMVKGKVNSIVLDSCKKTSVVFDDIVSCVEFINCQSMQAQSMGKVPTISIDKTDGVQVYLSKDSLNVEVVTAKASEINISIPSADGDFVEHAVPEQFKTVVVGKSLKTIPVDKA